MKKPRLAAIEYIRGISMMGVIGIHIGSQYLANQTLNVHLLALLEVATRFSVPIFFFISAFGLFYNLDMSRPLDYKEFLLRRGKTVLVPYVVWSLFYLIHDAVLYGAGFPSPIGLIAILFFGNAKYQLYFMVLLLWFYLLMPLWIFMVRRLGRNSLLILLAVQIAFDYVSSYSTAIFLYSQSLPPDSFIKPFITNRLNYVVLHYFFIFLLGGYLAVHFDEFKAFMQKKQRLICAAFALTLAAMLGHYYYLLYVTGYSPLSAVFTAHQLSPVGILYTIAASVFFFMIFTEYQYSAGVNNILHILGKHSYFAYLFHPVAITYLGLAIAGSGHVMTAPITIMEYFATLVISVVVGIYCRRLGEKIPLINKLTIGIYPRKGSAK